MINVCDEIQAKTSNVRDEFRRKIDLLSDRLSLLSGTDRLLMTMYLRNGNSFRQMALLTGLNAGSVARRINRLTSRLLDNTYLLCIQNRDRFTNMEMSIAKDYFITGLSLRKIMAKHKISYHHAWATMNKIKITVAVMRHRK